MRKPRFGPRLTGAWRSGWRKPVDFEVTGTPQDILAALSLSTGTRYSIQNIDPRGRIFVRVQATAPAAGERGNIIVPFEYGYPTAGPGEGIWVWSPDVGGSVAFVTEA